MNKTELLRKAVAKEDYDSTNAWGFGGLAGTFYIFENDVKILDAKAYYRHAQPHPYIKVFVGDKLTIDAIRLTKTQIVELNKLIS